MFPDVFNDFSQFLVLVHHSLNWKVEQEPFEELKRVSLKYVKTNPALLQQCVENFVSKP